MTTNETLTLELNAYKEVRATVSNAMRPIFTKRIMEIERELGLR